MGKRYSEAGIKDVPNYDGLNKVKEVGIEVNNNKKIILWQEKSCRSFYWHPFDKSL